MIFFLKKLHPNQRGVDEPLGSSRFGCDDDEGVLKGGLYAVLAAAKYNYITLCTLKLLT